MTTNPTPNAEPVLVRGILWDDNMGMDWEITVHGAANCEAALQACRDRSRVTDDDGEVLYITDWEIVDRFESAPFSQSRIIRL